MTEFAEILANAMGEPGEESDGCAFERSLRTFEAAVSTLAPTLGGRAARPRWAIELGVEVPCTVEDLKRAFRRRAFATHPDRTGGSHAAFLAVQASLREAHASLHAASTNRPRVRGSAYARPPERTSDARLRPTYC